MIRHGLICMLLAALAWGQAANQTPTPAPQKPTAPANATDKKADTKGPEKPPTSPDAAVITIAGVCDNEPVDKTAASDCKTVITRAQFENLVNALQPAMSPFARKRFATQYANAIVMAHQAHKMGLDQGPQFDEVLRFARLQVMSQLVGRSLQEKASEISDQEIEKYYKDNAATFEEAEMHRLFIPKAKQLDTPKEKLTDAQNLKRQQDAEAAMKAEAEKLHARAVSGEDFAVLETEAFLSAGVKAKAPNTSMGKVRRTNLPPNQVSAMNLKPGQVSELMSDQTGFFVYKAGKKDSLPLDQAKEEIHGLLQSQKMQDSMQAIQQAGTPTLDENYFALPAAPPPMGVTIPGAAPGAKPPIKAPPPGPK